MKNNFLCGRYFKRVSEDKACVPGHIFWVFVSNVDNSSPDLNLSGPSPDRSKQRERRCCQLSSEVMDPKVGSVHPKAYGLDVVVMEEG